MTLIMSNSFFHPCLMQTYYRIILKLSGITFILLMLCLSGPNASLINKRNLHLRPYHLLFGFKFEILVKSTADNQVSG